MWQVLKASQIIRGAAAALTILGLAPQILPYETLDLVSGVHAVIVGWNVLTGGIGAYLAGLFDIPDIPAEVVNTVVLSVAIGPAWAYSILRSEWGQHRGFVQNAAFWTRAVISFLEVPVMSLLVISLKPSAMFYLALAFLGIILMAVLRRFPTYRKGFLFALGFLVVMEGIYLASTERMQAAFDSFVCQHQRAGAPRCEPEEPA